MKQVKDAFVEVLVIFFVGGLVGSIMSVVSNLFVIAVKWVSQQRINSDILNINVGGFDISMSSLVFLWVAAAGMICIKKVFNIQKWAGPADSMYAAHQPDSPLDVKQGFASTLAAFTSLCGGASVGQYGPIVHFGATMGVVISKLQLRKRAGFSRLPREVYLGCGVAAAISAGFNAPIAGIIFAHEAILRHFSVRAIAPITVASITASSLGNYLFPQTLTFQITSAAPALAEIVPLLVILSPVFAGVAIAFMWSLRYATATAASMSVTPIAVPFIGATICGVIGIFVPQALGLGIGSVNAMISGEFLVPLLATVLVAKILMTSACIGFGVFGGVFSPALFIGVAAGALSAQLIAPLGFSAAGSVISVAAMAAVSSSVIGAPLSAVLIVLELSQSYEYAVAAMIAVMICTLITHRLFGHSFFDRQLLDRGIDLLKGREAIALEQQALAPFASQDYVRADPSDNGNKVRDEMENRGHTEAYIVNTEGLLLGKLNIYQAIACQDGNVGEFMDKTPITLYGDESLNEAMIKVSQFVGESLPVVEKSSNRLIGSIAEGELFQAVIDVQSEARTIERD
jgi:CIC family chloride channel protein